MKDELNKLVNTSGFPFQLAVEHSIQRSFSSHGWVPVVREHPWVDLEKKESGYIDILLDKKYWRVILECKRSQDAKWIFLLPKNESSAVRTFRMNWIAGKAGCHIKADIQDFAIKPSMPESQFCVIRGSGEKGTTLLERFATLLNDSSEALIAQEAVFRIASNDFAHMYIPMIVTNASLFTCVFDPGAISMKSGRIDVAMAQYAEVNYVCFRKTLTKSSGTCAPTGDLQRDNKSGQRSIIVVNSEHLCTLLNDFDVQESGLFDKMPWELEYQKG